MGIAKKTDGRYVVGLGVTDANDYKGSASYRDIYIQLTADGATEESVTYLTYLKDYAIYHSSLGEPIMPPSVNVWISNNGVTTAVEADDLSLDGDDFTICGIVYSDGTWDYSNAGSGHGGGGGGGGLPAYTEADIDKSLTVKKAAPVMQEVVVIPEQEYYCDGTSNLFTNYEDLSAIAEGATITFVVNGNTIERTLTSSGGGLVANLEPDAYIVFTFYDSPEEVDCIGNIGTYIISATMEKAVQPKIPKTILPQVTVTLEADSYFGMNYWAAAIPEDANVDTAFFEDAEVGDKATFVLDGETHESTASNFLGMTLFPIGLDGYVVGYASIFGGIGLAVMSEPAEMTHTISGTKEVDKVEPKWEEGFSIPDVDHSGDYLSVVGKGVIYDYDEMVAFIKAHPIVAFNYGYDKWFSAGYVINEGVEACYYFLIYENQAVTCHKYGVFK